MYLGYHKKYFRMKKKKKLEYCLQFEYCCHLIVNGKKKKFNDSFLDNVLEKICVTFSRKSKLIYELINKKKIKDKNKFNLRAYKTYKLRFI